MPQERIQELLLIMLIKSFVYSLLISLLLSLTVYADALDECIDAAKSFEFIKAPQLCEPLAEQGVAEAQFSLGYMYDYSRNYEPGVMWYKLAAEQGHPRALYNLAVMTRHGRGLPENIKDAIKLYHLSAEQGYSEAQWVLGERYQHGRNVIVNYTEAVRLYRLSAKHGHIHGMYNLAYMYREGKGIEQDIIYAYMWFNLAGEAGNSAAKGQREILSEKMTTKELRIAQELSQKCLDSNYKKCESALPNFLHRKFNLSNKDKD
jgi:TPR repeat protein